MFTRFASTLTVCLPLLLVPIGAFAADTPVAANDQSIAEINGKMVHLSDLERDFPTLLFQARSTYYDTERKVLDQYVDQYLLKQQAEKENLTVDQLIEKHVNSAIGPDPSEEALKVYFEGVDSKESFETLRPQILKVIHERRVAKAKNAFMLSLRSEATVTMHLAAPRAPLSLNEAPRRGPTDARVTLLEYADYQCPYCQQIQPAVDKLEKEYKGTIAFVFKDYPLPMHNNAEKAAEATQCARKQGKYWEYHDLIEKTKQLDPAQLKEGAKTLQLDTAAFDKCLDSGETADFVKGTGAEAEKLELQGTPSFFVNGRAVNGDVSYDKLRGVIEEELSATRSSAHAGSGDHAASKEEHAAAKQDPQP